MFRAAGPGSAAERILGEITRTTSQMLIVFNLVLSIALSQDFTNGEYDSTTLKGALGIVIIFTQGVPKEQSESFTYYGF